MGKPESDLPKLIVALDNCSMNEARELVAELSGAGVNWFKVGLELYTRTGPAFVSELKGAGHKVFLDLKLYDIPNTVAKAVGAARDTGADLLTLHCSGGPEMLTAANESVAGSSLALLGVTVLTSFADSSFERVSVAWGARHGARIPRGATALRLAEFAATAGLHGVVCSASDLHDGELQKLPWIRRPLLVTPGIRNQTDACNDQKSVATVVQAVQLGATHLVIGRPITALTSGCRARAAKSFLQEIRLAYGFSTDH